MAQDAKGKRFDARPKDAGTVPAHVANQTGLNAAQRKAYGAKRKGGRSSSGAAATAPAKNGRRKEARAAKAPAKNGRRRKPVTPTTESAESAEE